jgi:hypothetical protein
MTRQRTHIMSFADDPAHPFIIFTLAYRRGKPQGVKLYIGFA